jgi:outer membrane protein OmpA-like peptidoglycan-associated protein
MTWRNADAKKERFRYTRRPRVARQWWTRWMLLPTAVATFVFVVIPVTPVSTSASTISTSTHAVPHKVSHGTLDVSQTTGTPNSSEPSNYAPPSATALAGYNLSYVNDFTGTTVPSGWSVYTGTPGSGDPGSQWAINHVTVGGGELQLNTFKDPAFNNEWVTGGLCQCGVDRLYGAYFVRSRVTGPGSTQVELLWPKIGWPPEIDFDETGGGTTLSQATLHWSAANSQIHNQVNTDMTQWHTWGVIWTPTSVTYTLDGTIWGEINIAADVPQQVMTLDIQQQTWCSATPSFACPTVDDSTQVDWVAEYSTTAPAVTSTTMAPPAPPAPPAPTTFPTTTTTAAKTTTTIAPASLVVTVKPFAKNSAALTPHLETEISSLADWISSNHLSQVTLTGYGTILTSRGKKLALGRARAMIVERYLRQRLAALHVKHVSISVLGAAITAPTGIVANGRVVALVR